MEVFLAIGKTLSVPESHDTCGIENLFLGAYVASHVNWVVGVDDRFRSELEENELVIETGGSIVGKVGTLVRCSNVETVCRRLQYHIRASVGT